LSESNTRKMSMPRFFASFTNSFTVLSGYVV